MNDTLYILLVVPYVSEEMYLFGSFLLYFLSFLSLSVIFFTYRWSLYASASETNTVGFTEFLLQNIRGGGGLYSGWGGDK